MSSANDHFSGDNVGNCTSIRRRGVVIIENKYAPLVGFVDSDCC
jgi:hypothetical protein